MQIDATHGATLFANQRAEAATESAEAGDAFEGYLIEMMLGEMRKTVPEGIFSSSAMEMFSGLLDQHVATSIADSGGLGISALLQRSIPGGADGESGPAAPPVSTRLRGTQRFQPQEHGCDHDHGHAHGEEGHLPVDGRVTSRFGLRSDPFHRRSRMHKGLDIAAQQGTPIRPIRPGRVVFSGDRGGFGNAVIIDHGDGLKSVYAHCHELNVREGDAVGEGTVIGTVGSTGRSTGPHLHLEVHRDGEAINPEPYVGM
jgi:murein DD-endopeptidase MepM/ murein hydrolase activator NlpD